MKRIFLSLLLLLQIGVFNNAVANIGSSPAIDNAGRMVFARSTDGASNSTSRGVRSCLLPLGKNSTPNDSLMRHQ